MLGVDLGLETSHDMYEGPGNISLPRLPRGLQIPGALSAVYRPVRQRRPAKVPGDAFIQEQFC